MRHMRGVSLLELMVAMALGLLLSAAAIQLFVANQISVNLMRGMNDVQANGRFVIDQMVRDLRLSGLMPSSAGTSAVSLVGVPFYASEVPGLGGTSTDLNRNGISTTGSGGVPGLLQASDQVVVQYVAMGPTEDCEGNAVATGQFMVARYFVRADNGVASLACDAGTHAGTAGSLVNYGDDGQVVLSGVDSFQVLYGIDDGADGVARVERYVDAATYMALAPRPTVLTVRLGLYMHSSEPAGNVSRPANNVQVLDMSLAATNIPNDRLLRRLFVTTVSLRNLILSGV